jgi:hypothetical protein
LRRGLRRDEPVVAVGRTARLTAAAGRSLHFDL